MVGKPDRWNFQGCCRRQSSLECKVDGLATTLDRRDGCCTLRTPHQVCHDRTEIVDDVVPHGKLDPDEEQRDL